MKHRGLIFGYELTPTGQFIFAMGAGILLCQTLDVLGVEPWQRGGFAAALVAVSGLCVRGRPGVNGRSHS